jgi:hypothetical protein
MGSINSLFVTVGLDVILGLATTHAHALLLAALLVGGLGGARSLLLGGGVGGGLLLGSARLRTCLALRFTFGRFALRFGFQRLGFGRCRRRSLFPRRRSRRRRLFRLLQLLFGLFLAL